MSSKPCEPEPIVMSNFCRIWLCPDCGIVHFDLPYRVSFQFESEQFLGLANAFAQAAQIINMGNSNVPEGQPKGNVVQIAKRLN